MQDCIPHRTLDKPQPNDRDSRVTTVGESSDARRVVTLNILHGGGSVDRGGALLARLLSYDADILVVTEFRANRFGELLIGRLQRAGYATSHPGADSARNSVLIASRSSIDRSWAFSDELDACRLWCVDIGGTVVCGVLMPQKNAKLPYWNQLIDRGRCSGVNLFIGDFNMGNNELDKDPRGARFFGAEMRGRLIESGYVDVWRSMHPDIREYSWFSPGVNNGFRIDHAYAVPELAQRITACEFDHTPRLLRETDHSALIVTLTRT